MNLLKTETTRILSSFGLTMALWLSLDVIKQIFTRYMEHIHDSELMRNRSTKMKEFGKKRILRQKQKQDTPKVASSKVGRNDPCLCGSGKKYKKCCGIMVG